MPVSVYNYFTHLYAYFCFLSNILLTRCYYYFYSALFLYSFLLMLSIPCEISLLVHVVLFLDLISVVSAYILLLKILLNLSMFHSICTHVSSAESCIPVNHNTPYCSASCMLSSSPYLLCHSFSLSFSNMKVFANLFFSTTAFSLPCTLIRPLRDYLQFLSLFAHFILLLMLFYLYFLFYSLG